MQCLKAQSQHLSLTILVVVPVESYTNALAIENAQPADRLEQTDKAWDFLEAIT